MTTSMLDVNFGDTHEPQLFPVDEEVTVRIVSVSIHESQSGNISTHFVFKSASEAGLVAIHEYVGGVKPNPENDTKIDETNNNNKLKLMRLFKCFGIELDAREIDLSNPVQNDFTGREGTVICTTDEDTTGQYSDKSRIKTFVYNE